MTRNYIKGRDYYDLFWYLGTHKGLSPNLEFLKNALRQFRGLESSLESDAENWKEQVVDILNSTDWGKILKEVELLVEDREELDLFTKENLLMLLHKQ
ncbi:MAG: nucleotidyl transferase AbiEii/AbiGii toxin family protein [bacterium]|nr:nucleotidyl transferase AbiEii/AbiGii toxin family protein [bacterium]